MSEYPEEADLDIAADAAQAMADEESDETTPYKRRFIPGKTALAYAARTRRELLGIRQEDAAERFRGPSVTSLWTIENAQADSYRTKTLYSLDDALAWVRGTSMAILTGEVDRIDYRYLENMGLDSWNRNSFSSVLSEQHFDQFVDHVVGFVSNDDMLKYDMPIRSASVTISYAESSPALVVANKPIERDEASPEIQWNTASTTLIPDGTVTFDDVVDAIVSMSAKELGEIGRMAKSLAEIIGHLEGKDDEALTFIRETSAMKTKMWYLWQQEMHKKANDGER